MDNHLLNRGSEWHRWEPHIHAPGTLLNNQFNGPNPWDDYISALEGSIPVIEAIAITDYYVTETYQIVKRYKEDGRLPNIKLIFPNIELRLDVATSKGGFVNLHLFISPEDEDHLEQLHRLLSRLHFIALGDRFDCTRADLIRLGKKSDPSITDENKALRQGANQFKVNFQALRDVFNESDWAKNNILIAVAGGANDGTSGVKESADQTMRREIEGFAHIIFASSEAQREFWLGRRALSADEMKNLYRGLKPCMHGSDAHRISAVGVPAENRFSWIKGALEFDALRQACIDPFGRSHVGEAPPSSTIPSEVIHEIQILDSPWVTTPTIPLNSGLIAIIGARGSGKTALADIIAAGCDSIPNELWATDEWSNPSFLVRARPLLGQGKVTVSWAAGDPLMRSLNGSDANEFFSYPRVRYLSQQFVEDLCSSRGITDGLLHEIERVIFLSHPEDEREGALNFAEILEYRASRYRLARERETEAVSHISERIGLEYEKDSLVKTFESQVAQKTLLVAAYTNDRAKLVSAGSEQRAKRHNELAVALSAIKVRLRNLSNQRQTFLAMQDEVTDLRTNQAPEALRQAKMRHPFSGLADWQWNDFLLDYKGDVDIGLDGYIKWVDNELAKLKGSISPPPIPDQPLFPDNTDLTTLTQAILEMEMGRLEKLVSIDKDAQNKYRILSGKIATETAALQTAAEKLTDCRGAMTRIKELQKEREAAYGRIFDSIIAEQKVLEKLYSPLMTRLEQSSGTLKKLSFSVSRIADVGLWASNAESTLLDLRKGELKGKGTLADKANELLKTAWENGSSESIVAAMSEFRKIHQSELLSHSPIAQTEQAEFRVWIKDFALWLFSTDHISIRYSIEYDGVDIRKLSPGTRGIVLLLLYLALDDADGRPLIIDQPEENLDPQSVFDELVPLLINAKSKRQVIMVTHNANLVINTDADQIIIAKSGHHPPGALPPISYTSGGLESASIRKSVCDILEGGEKAFKERARRLRVRLER